MTLHIDKTITQKRREKGWTQEQLAKAVGVSTPAVSKWETGASYPDITLLSPIARALNTTVDELLSFQNELSSDQVSEFAKAAAEKYESEGFDAGWEQCQKLLQEYPNSIPLKFHLGGLFQSFLLLKEDATKEELLAYYRRAADIYEDVLASGDPSFSYPSTVILVGYYVILEELDRAEELLDGLPKIQVDPSLLYPSIYALRGDRDDAMRLTQENIRRYVAYVGQSLTVLCADAREQGELSKAHALAEINLGLAELFGIGEEKAYPDIIKTLTAQGNLQDALTHFEAYAHHILELSYDYSGNPVFDRLPKQPSDPSYIRKALAQSVLRDGGYGVLSSEERYQQAVDRLRTVVDAETHTFENDSQRA